MCRCQHADFSVPTRRSEAHVLAHHQTAVEDLLDEVATSHDKWLRVLRCRCCGRCWAEDSWMSGQMDISYVYPIDTADPDAWLAQAETLDLDVDVSL